MKYVSPVGKVYKKDGLLDRWMEIPEEYLLAEKNCLSADPLSAHHAFCLSLSKDSPTIALNATDSLTILTPIGDKETSLHILNILLEHNAYIPGHSILQSISNEAILASSERFKSCIFSESPKKSKVQEDCDIVKKALEVQERLGDITYAYEQVSLLKLSQYLPMLDQMIFNSWVVSASEYKKLKNYLKTHPQTLYCTVNSLISPPVDISMFERPRTDEIRKYLGSSELYSTFYETPRSPDLIWDASAPGCLINLPILVIEEIINKTKKERRKKIISIVNEHAQDVGVQRNMCSFYREIFSKDRNIQYEGILLEISFEAEYKRLVEEQKLLSETEEGEIK
ncbi:hypothetical protein NEMIN01_1645 [Nematocida minor]|uniref:uncharacterized protein n=1 Tax=Nematocida minor TaxID=1912983 RepID=UPI00222049CA|nr:uncharacterized protein NEMIN01_1645 [Nematocida minor]KAI5191754.1 hypothetical protein NEMIN01_1645 [Nematocida minor]